MSKLDWPKYKPVYPFLIVRRLPPANKIGIIILPDVQDFDNRECEVLAVHDGKPNEGGENTHKSEISKGDIILVFNYDGEKLNDYDDPYVERVDERNVIAIKVKNDSLER